MNCCSDERDNKRSPIPTSSSFTPSLVTTVITDVVSHVPAAFGGDGKQLSRTRRKDTDHEQQRRKQKRPVAAAAGYRRVEQPWRHVGGSSERTPPLPAPNGQDEEKKKGRRQPEYDLFPLQARGRQTGDNGVAQVAGCRRRSSESSVMAQLSRPPFSQSSPTTCASSSAKVNTFFGSCDDSRYWDYAFRPTNKGDMGHLCRECKRPFSELNAVMAVRRGGRIELRYHEGCFSMKADPRSQPASSANRGKFVESLKGTEAPQELYRKMRTRGHW